MTEMNDIIRLLSVLDEPDAAEEGETVTAGDIACLTAAAVLEKLGAAMRSGRSIR